MKMTHEILNDEFGKLDIHTKRMLLNIWINKERTDRPRKFPKTPKLQFYIVGEQFDKLRDAWLNYYRYKEGAYHSIHNHAIKLAADCLKYLTSLPLKRFVDESPETEPLFQIQEKDDKERI